MPFINMKCTLCNCTLKSSHAILIHLNTKKHARICAERKIKNIADVILFTPVDSAFLETIDWPNYVGQAISKAMAPPKDKIMPVYLVRPPTPIRSDVPFAPDVEHTPPSGIVNLTECMKSNLSVSAPMAVHNIPPIRPKVVLRISPRIPIPPPLPVRSLPTR